ncbi:hypothetical protein AB6T85_21550 [Erwinia sp. ACCC 02193]|jgi:hypothetical protein|uniref:KTSC domain-containing protein n=1 Tax=Erwinia aeris TaxID=3239803 RepID=A0ABV4EDR6_9GAMM
MEKDIFFERLKPWAYIGFNQVIILASDTKRELYATTLGVYAPPRLFIRELSLGEYDNKTHANCNQFLKGFYAKFGIRSK